MAEHWNHFGSVAEALEHIVPDILAKVALDAEAGYKAKIRENGQIATGNMLNSCFSVTQKGSTWGSGPDRDEPPTLSQKYQAFAGIAASYAVYQNYGTVHLAARPFFEPVNERAQDSFVSAIEAAVKGLERFNQ